MLVKLQYFTLDLSEKLSITDITKLTDIHTTYKRERVRETEKETEW